MSRGRKKATRLWLPQQSDVFGPFIGELILKQSTPLSAAITYLANLSIYQPAKNLEMLEMYQLISWSVAYVARRRWSANIELKFDGKPLSGTMRTLVERQGEMFSALLELVTEVHLISPRKHTHAAFWWLNCILESECTPIISYSNKADCPTGKGEYVADFQSITQRLKELEAKANPFFKPWTKELFDVAMETADKTASERNLFYAQKYKPYLDARSNMASFLRKKGTETVIAIA